MAGKLMEQRHQLEFSDIQSIVVVREQTRIIDLLCRAKLEDFCEQAVWDEWKVDRQKLSALIGIKDGLMQKTLVRRGSAKEE